MELKYVTIDEENVKRVYYPDVCLKCFGTDNLFHCECKAVQYCSKKHQDEDAPTHRRICAFLKMRKFTAGMDRLSFVRQLHRDEGIMRNIVTVLSPLEKDICFVPNVCPVCFTQDNLKYNCKHCSAVKYCSLEHKASDLPSHSRACKSLMSCMVYNSLGYEKGMKLPAIDFNYLPVRQGQRHFPATMKELLKLHQKEVPIIHSDADKINLSLFADRYTAAATILSCFTKIGLMKNRKFKWRKDKQLTKNSSKYSAPLVLHFVDANEYELGLQWQNFIGHILDWLVNVSDVKIFLIGRELVNCKPPNCEGITGLGCFAIYPVNYEDVVDHLEKPDAVVLFNCGYPKLWDLKDTLRYGKMDFLLKYIEVPVIVTSPFDKFLKEISLIVQQNKNHEIVVEAHPNDFSDNRAFRFWGNTGVFCCYYNRMCAVYRRKF